MHRSLLRVLLLSAVVSSPLAAQEQEEILAFDAHVEIHDGGRLVVTEEITVRSLGQEIRRGIYRDFPTDFPRERGFGRIQAPFTVLSVERDGGAEPWSTESIGGPGGRGGVRVRIGDADVLLDDGVHRYRLTYETWRWVRFGPGEDRLYWNVTGNGWDFTIVSASASVTLPRAVDGPVSLEGWTGPEGSTASDARWNWDAEARTATFRTTRSLEPREGLTLRVVFPSGIVAPPSADVEATWFRMDWGGYLDALSVFGLVFALYLLMWTRVGRDPPARPLVVRYEPPPGFSPASLGYIRNRGYAQELLTAALVSLGVHRALSIRKEKRHWSLTREGTPEEAVAADERVLLAKLLGSRSTLALESSQSSTLQDAIKAQKSALRTHLERHYFELNRRWFAAGLALSIVGFAALAWRDRYGISPEVWFFGLWLSFWSIGVGTLVLRAWRAWRAALGGAGFGSWVEAVFMTLFSIPFVGAEIFVLWLLTVRMPQHLMIAAVGLGLLNVLFYHLLERPTLKGRGVLDHLEGFRAFLSSTDGDRLDRTLVPDRTPELFERYLPHAIALGVENRWAEGFKDALVAGASAAATGSGSLAWYQGGSSSDLGTVASSLGGGFSSSLSTASSPPPSSGGGGSSGGSSGGGGGGGGGGGW
jgi:hypothetical protein